MTEKTPIKGMISDAEFKARYPDKENVCNRTVVVRGDTFNTWVQHEDGSWSNTECHTVPNWRTQ